MNLSSCTSAALAWSVFLAIGISMLAPPTARADESQLRLPARRSAARLAEDRSNDDGPSEVSDRRLEQVFGLDEPRRHHPLRVVTSSLAIVLGGFALFLILFRRPAPAVSSGMMDTLGTIQVTPKVQLHLVRLGDRLLLLHLTPEKVARVAEVTDPSEVQSLLATHHAVARQSVSGRIHEFLQGGGASGVDFAGMAGSSKR